MQKNICKLTATVKLSTSSTTLYLCRTDLRNPAAAALSKWRRGGHGVENGDSSVDVP